MIAAVFHKDLPRSYRSAGAVLDVVHDDEGRLRQFRAAFRLALARRAPGLVYSDSLATADDDQSARKAARNSVSAAGPIRGIRMPLGSPITRPAPKSGANPAILPGWSKGGKCKITGEFADLATQTVRKHLDEAKRLSLAEKFTPKEKTGLKWPTIFRKDEDGKERGNLFPFEAGTLPKVAVLHADGNGIGKLYADAITKFAETDPAKIRQLSLALGQATLGAVRKAMEPVVAKEVGGVVPARPILLGGDDVSILLRADLAIQFALDFAYAFQEGAKAAVNGVLGDGKDRTLTTKIGIVVVGPNQPFAHAYELAESLAKAARHSESRIAFHRVTTAAIPDAAEVLADQGRTGAGQTLWRSAHSLQDITALRELARLLDDDDVGRGGLRRVPELLKTKGMAEAQPVFDRAMDMVKSRSTETHTKLGDALMALGARTGFLIPDAVTHDDQKLAWCPLLQAHDLAHIERSRG